MVYAWTNNTKCIVHVGQLEQRFALYVCACDVDSVKRRRVVVEYAEEVVVVSERVVVGVFLGNGRCCWDMQGRNVDHAAEEA